MHGKTRKNLSGHTNIQPNQLYFDDRKEFLTLRNNPETGKVIELILGVIPWGQTIDNNPRQNIRSNLNLWRVESKEDEW